jgi:hypothetical protein
MPEFTGTIGFREDIFDPIRLCDAYRKGGKPYIL